MNPKYEIDECLNKVKGDTFYEVFRNGMSHGFFATREKAEAYISGYSCAKALSSVKMEDVFIKRK
jgi:viroplasmin and RNaseH domain-containing protein